MPSSRQPSATAPRSSPARPDTPGGDASLRIALEIRRHLARSDLHPGDRLGTEQGLAREFGVSRPTIREALRVLASSHLIRASRGPGGGIFVASTPSEGMSHSLSEAISTMLETRTVSLQELVEARILLEVPLAGLAALHVTPEAVLRLEAAIADQEGKHAALDPFRLADACFHRTIAATAGNDLMRAFASWTLDVLQPSLIDAIGDRSTPTRSSGSTTRSCVRFAVANPPGASARCAVTSSTCSTSSACSNESSGLPPASPPPCRGRRARPPPAGEVPELSPYGRGC